MMGISSRSLRFHGVAMAMMIGLAAASPGVMAADDAQFRSETEIRLMEMENRLRTVTGQYEEAMYRLTQMNRQMENRLADMDFRLQQLEQGGVVSPAAGAEGDVDAMAPVDAAQADQSSADASVVEASVAESGPGAPTEAAAPAAAPAEDVVTPESHPERYLSEGTAEEQFDEVFRLVRRNKLTQAIESFRAWIALHPDHPHQANAMYWMGRSHAVLGDHGEAASVLVAAYDKHADSEKGAEILLHLGLSLEQLGQNEDACSAFGELERRFTGVSGVVKESMIDGQKRAGCN